MQSSLNAANQEIEILHRENKALEEDRTRLLEVEKQVVELKEENAILNGELCGIEGHHEEELEKSKKSA